MLCVLPETVSPRSGQEPIEKLSTKLFQPCECVFSGIRSCHKFSQLKIPKGGSSLPSNDINTNKLSFLVSSHDDIKIGHFGTIWAQKRPSHWVPSSRMDTCWKVLRVSAGYEDGMVWSYWIDSVCAQILRSALGNLQKGLPDSSSKSCIWVITDYLGICWDKYSPLRE